MRPRSLFGLLFIAAARLAAIEFEPNIGQMPASYRFAAKSRHGEILGEASGNLTYRTRHRENVTLAWQHSQPGAWNAEQPTARRVRYCVAGAQPEACEKGTSTYSRMRRSMLYEGIDLVVHAANGAIEYDLEVQPGANLDEVRFELHAETTPQLDQNGRIVAGNVLHWRPVAWQTEGAARRKVDCELRQISDRVFGFSITGPYRKDLPLVIDPVIETARVITGPEQGDDKILGGSGDHTFGVSRRAGSDNWDIFISYRGWTTTYWGGDGDEQLHGFTQPSNNQELLLLTGSTSSRNTLQLGPGARAPYHGGPADGFFLVVAEGTIYRATLVGGPGTDRIHGIMDTTGIGINASFVLIGETDDPNWNGFSVNGQARGGADAIAVSYTGAGGSIFVMGGSGDDRARMVRSVAATPESWLLAGETDSPDFPGKTTPGKDLWFARFTLTPFRIDTPATWGGEGEDTLAGFEFIEGHGLMAAGTTNSTRLPGAPADLPGFNGGTADGFVAWLNPLDFTPIQSRYLGGPGSDGILSIALRQNDLYLAGFTDSTTLSLPEMMPGSDPAGLEDGLFIHTDALLNPITAYRAGGSGNDRFTSVQPRSLGRVDLTGWSESRPWLATLQSSPLAGDTVAGFSLNLRYAATAVTEYNSLDTPPILTLGRDQSAELVVSAQNEPGSDGILILRSLDPSKLRINGEESVLISRAGVIEGPLAFRLEALAAEGEVDLLIGGRTPSAIPIRYPERRLRVRLVPTRAFIAATPETTWIVRRGFDFNVPVRFAQVLPNGEPGPRRNLRSGVNLSFRVTSSDPAIAEPTGAEARYESAGVYFVPFRALREGTATLSLESTGIPAAPGQQQRVRVGEAGASLPPWTASRTLLIHHTGSMTVGLTAGDRLQFTAENPARVAISLSSTQPGNVATIATPGSHGVFFTALEAGDPAGFRVEGTIAGRAVNERFEVRPIPYVLTLDQSLRSFTGVPGSTAFVSFRTRPKSETSAAESFDSAAITPGSPLANAALVFSAAGIAEQTSRTFRGVTMTIGLRALQPGRTSVSFDVDAARDLFSFEVVSPRIQFASPLVVPAASRIRLVPNDIYLPGRSMQSVRLRVSHPELLGIESQQRRGPDLTVDFSGFFPVGLEVKGPPGSEGFLYVSTPDTEEFSVPIKIVQKVLVPRFRAAQGLIFQNETVARGYLSYTLAAFDPSATIANGMFRTIPDLGDLAGSKVSIKTTPEGICDIPAEAALSQSGLQLPFVCRSEGNVKIDLQGAGLSEQQQKLSVTLTVARAASPISANRAVAPIILAAGTQRELSLFASNTQEPALFNGTLASSDPERVKLAAAPGRLGTGQITIANSAPATVQGFGSDGVVWLKAESNDGFRSEIPIFLFPATMAVRTTDSTPQANVSVTADTPSIMATVAPLAVDPTSGFTISGAPLSLRAGTEPFFLKTKSSDDKVAAPVPPDLLFSDLERSRETSFKINGSGTAALSAIQPPAFVDARDGGLRLTVVERVLRLNVASAPAGLQTFASVSASGQNGSAQAPLTLTSLDPSKLLLAADRSAQGTPSLATAPGRNFLIQVLRTAQPGEILRLQMSGPGFQEAVAEILVSEPILAWTDPAPSELQPGSANSYSIRFGPVDPYNPLLVNRSWSGWLLPGERLRLSLRTSDPSIITVPASIDLAGDVAAQFQLRALRPGTSELSIEAPPEINNRVRIAPLRVKLWEFPVSSSEIGSRGLWSPLIIPNPRDEPTVVSVSGTAAAFALVPTALPANTIQVTIPARARSTIYWTSLGNFVSSDIRLNAQDFTEHKVSSPVFESYLNFPANPLQVSLSARTAAVALRLLSAGTEKPLAAAPMQVELRSSDSRIVRVVNPQVGFNTGQSSASVNLEFLAPGTAVITASPPAALGLNAGTNSLTVVVR